MLVLILAFAARREATKVAVLALGDLLDVALVRQEQHLISRVFQVDDPRFQPERFCSLDMGFLLAFR